MCSRTQSVEQHMCRRSLGKSNGIAVNEKFQSMTNFEGRLEDETHRNGVGV
jgi:hypothetical protein